MEKHLILVGLGVLGLLVGVPLYGSSDSWTRSWALVALQAGIVFFAVGLGAWSVVDAIRQRPPEGSV